MPIDTRHSSYEEQVCRWSLVEDALKGEHHVKKKGTKYLPAPPAMAGSGAWSRANKDTAGGVGAYEFYLSFAEFPEIVSDVLGGYQGLIHAKPPTVELPEDMKYLYDSATPSGLSVREMWQIATRMVLKGGRVSLLPDIGEDGKFRIAVYSSESLINWNEFLPKDGGGFSFAVLHEISTEPDPQDSFELKEVERALELFMLDGQYWRQWWKKIEGDDGKDKWEIEELASRVEWKGKPIGRIPLHVINASDLGTSFGQIPMYGMAKRAFSIYRKTADYNRSLYTKSDPQIVLSGVTDDDSPTNIGGSTIWAFVNPAASASYLDIDGQGIPLQRTSIEDEYRRFHEEGGKLIHSEGGKGESGEALQTRAGANQVTLKSVTINIGRQIQSVLRDIARMMNMGEDEVDKVVFSPDLDFAQPTMSGQELLNFIQSKNQSAPISNQTIHALMHRGGITEIPFAEEMKLVEQERAEAEKHAKQPNARTPNPDDGESVNKTDAEKAAEAEIKKANEGNN